MNDFVPVPKPPDKHQDHNGIVWRSYGDGINSGAIFKDCRPIELWKMILGYKHRLNGTTVKAVSEIVELFSGRESLRYRAGVSCTMQDGCLDYISFGIDGHELLIRNDPTMYTIDDDLIIDDSLIGDEYVRIVGKALYHFKDTLHFARLKRDLAKTADILKGFELLRNTSVIYDEDYYRGHLANITVNFNLVSQSDNPVRICLSFGENSPYARE